MKKLLSIILSITLMLSFTAFAADDDASVIASDIASLTSDSLLTAPLVDGEYLVDSLRLPTSGTNGSVISWASDHESIISSKGTVTRPAEQAANVTLTATVSYGSATPQTKSFTFRVAPLNMPMEGIDDFGALAPYVGSDFAVDGWMNNKIFINSTYTPAVSAGLATFTGTESRFYWNGGGSAATAYVEFVMRRTAAETVVIKPMYNNGNGFKVAELHWYIDGTIRYYYGTSNASTVYNLNDSSNSLKLGIYIDGSNNSYSLWANNVLVANNVKMAKTEAVSLQSVNFNTTTAGTLQFEEYRFYNVTPIDDATALKSVTADAQAITESSLLTAPLTADGYLLDSLVLPTAGANYSKISWHSSNEAVISTTGTVNRPSQSVDGVVLTAAITRASASETKTFTFKVAPLNMPMKGIDDFGALSFVKGSDFTNSNWKDTSSVFLVPAQTPEVSNGVATSPTDTRFYDGGLSGHAYYVEFVMKRTRAESVAIKAYSHIGNGWMLREIAWNADGTVTYQSDVTTEEVYSDKLKLGMYMDTDTHTYSLWLDNVLVASNLSMNSYDDFQVMYFKTATEGTLQFEEYRFYNVGYSYRAVAESGAYKASFYVPEIGGTHGAFKCYLALYDGSELVALKLSDADAGSCDGRNVAQIEFTDEEVASFNPTQPDCKAFIWSADNLCTPLAKSKNVTK